MHPFESAVAERDDHIAATAGPGRDLALPAGDRERPAGSWAIQAAQFIYLNYPAADALDVNVFYRTAGRALEDFPVWVIAALCCPKSGIIARQKWPPKIAELVRFCESLMRARVLEAQLAENEMLRAEADRQRREIERAAEENRRKDEAIRSAMSRLTGGMYVHNGPVPGMRSYMARHAWECALVRENPVGALEAIVDILNAQPRLIEEATKAEINSAGAGWKTIAPIVMRSLEGVPA